MTTIAEEVGVVVPEVASWEENGRDARSVDYGRLTALLIEATKKQQALIHRQQEQIRAQQAQITRLSSQIKVIQASLSGEWANQFGDSPRESHDVSRMPRIVPGYVPGKPIFHPAFDWKRGG